MKTKALAIRISSKAMRKIEPFFHFDFESGSQKVGPAASNSSRSTAAKSISVQLSETSIVQFYQRSHLK